MKKLRSLLITALVLAGLSLVSTPATAAVPSSTQAVVACAGHVVTASYTTAGGNLYQMQNHNCGDADVNSSNARTHWHCLRNGASWDGCRVNTELLVQFFSTGGIWTDATQTSKTIANPGGSYTCNGSGSNPGFFQDSTTSTSYPFDFANGTLLRGAAKDPDNARFCLADGSTVIRDVTNSVSGTWTHT